ncbi:MAG: arginine-tRNA-protein transferase [Acidobacteriota bacterium]|jgi:arginine-tRNA-protein transferase|nr:arginine-tRNA-protein transferase [Acidobacteriota bacterium]
MNLAEFNLINEEFYASKVTPRELDFLLAEGWRHFGQHFYRYNLGFLRDKFRFVIPLRIRLADFKFSKSQRRILNKNKNLQTVIRPIEFDDEKLKLFERHKLRFNHGIPASIYNFLDVDAAEIPCEAVEVCVYDKDKLLAVSFLDVGETSVSSIYGMFELNESKRSLGILTMMLEIRYAIENEKTFYYQGYAYEGDSFYDYKKRFKALERYDWFGNWEKFVK